MQLVALSRVKGDDTHLSRRDTGVEEGTCSMENNFSFLRVDVGGTLEGLGAADMSDEARPAWVRPREARCRCTIVGTHTTDHTRVVELSRSKLSKGRVHSVLSVEEDEGVLAAEQALKERCAQPSF